MKKLLLSAAGFVLLTLVGCKKEFLDVKPSNAVPESVFLGTATSLELLLNSIYLKTFEFGTNETTGHDNFNQKSVDLSSDLRGNDMVVHTQGYGWFNADYQYTEWQLQDARNRKPDMFWSYYYVVIKDCNTVINYIDNATGTDAAKKSIKGQALGLRAYAYYYLINIYQHTYKGNETKPGVPIHLDRDFAAGKPRGTVQNVYDQIIKDLTDAEALLTGVTQPSKARLSVNAIQGFRARVALVMEDWAMAASYANKARQGFAPMSAALYAAGFSTIGNPEWMWGAFIPADQATIFASFFSHMDANTLSYAQLGGQKKITKALYDQMDDADVRKANFRKPGTGTTNQPDYAQNKHRLPVPSSWAADYLYMRASEMYLIEAEALARQNQDAGARTVLEALVKARFPAYSAAGFSGASLLNEVLLQRRIELWGEGFGMFDIKRLKTGLNRPRGAGNHGSPSFDANVYELPDGDSKFVMRIPRREMDNNPAFTAADQNP